ncbi:F-box protein PP2-B15-like [Miscanthus floridulus]|uniref:F-box protein PP2-B15-like n=1 Tax=Miscanthus floridulus TaxID=154761 RepID=UPI003457F2D3
MPPEQETQVGDLPEVCLAQVIARTSPRDASRCAAVSPAFCAAADSDDVWGHFLPTRLDLDRLLLLPPPPPAPAAVAAKTSTKTTCSTDDHRKRKKKKDAYLGLCDAGALVDDGGEDCVRVWLEKATGARCYALSARRLSLPWDDGEFSWRWPPHPLSRFPDVAELVDCTCLDIYGTLPAAALTPGTPYAAYLVYGTAEGGHRGLSFPDQETTVAVGGRVVARHAVCLRPHDAEARKFRAVAAAARAEVGVAPQPRQPRLRGDGWWEMEMGRVVMCGGDEREEGEEVVASFEVLGWYPKRGLIIEAIEFKPVR